MNENRRVKDVAEYLKEVSETKAKWPNSTLVFRGQEKEKWLLESSAERRLKASLPIQKEITAPFLEYNENLIKKCKLKNYDKREQKQLDDLELLADLQHHGAATCLIDFTRNALVALWFACQKSDADGKVFVVNIADQKTFLEIAHTDIQEAKSISDILKFKTRNTNQDQSAIRSTPEISVASPNFWYWTPAHLNERIPAQHSLFLFGLPSSGKLGAEEIIIESVSKERIQKELEALHDICEESLFPDFVGFSNIQRADALYLTLDAEEYLRRGIEAGQRGQYSDSIQDLTKAIELEPDHADAYNFRGLAYDNQGKHDHAIQDYTKAIELEPDHTDAYYLRGLAYSSQGKHDHAIQDHTKAIELEPDHADAYNFRGLAYDNQGKHDHAIQDYTKAIELEPDYADAYHGRGDAYDNQGKHDHAIQDHTKAIELDPDHADAYYSRGDAYDSQEKYDRAIQDYTKAIELDPDHADAYYSRGLAYSNRGELKQAIQDLTKAIELDPDHADAYYSRGLAYDSQGKHDHAIQDYTKAIELDSEHADAYHFRGDAYSNRGELKQAIQDLTKAIELDPDYAEAYYSRGLAWLYLKKWQEAKSDLIAAKNMGLDIVDWSQSDNKSVADLEQKIGITLPEDIAAMLTENKN